MEERLSSDEGLKSWRYVGAIYVDCEMISTSSEGQRNKEEGRDRYKK
jgi:hypothetical protein